MVTARSPSHTCKNGGGSLLACERMSCKRNIVLIGFMGSGKTEVGRRLAQLLNCPLVDTDEIIERRAGMRISEIFEKHGEATFRAMEREVIREVASDGGKIISTGGGVPTFDENVEALRKTGWLVYLRASPITLWYRVRTMTDRPLLEVEDRFTRIVELLNHREPFYRQADIIIHTDELSPDEVSAQIAKWVNALPDEGRIVPVCLNGRTYHIIIGTGLLNRTPMLLEIMNMHPPLALVTDECVAKFYADVVVHACERYGWQLSPIVIPTGESSKTLNWAGQLYDKLAMMPMTRDGALIALGGGVVGDLAGFVAATYMRGIGLANLPTTLLAQVDAAIGGKVAVDHPKGKNLIGCFYQPQLVVNDVSTLRTLPERVYQEGLAEVVKYGVIADANLFEHLENNVDAILNRDPEALIHIIAHCCRIKARVVEEDERELTGKRAILNYGHTFGHALEAVTNYQRFLHGEAVAIGMMAAAHLSVRIGWCSEEVLHRQRRLLQLLGLPTRVQDAKLSAQAIYDAMALDKKRRGKLLRFVLPERIGGVRLTEEPIPEQLVMESINFITAPQGNCSCTL